MATEEKTMTREQELAEEFKAGLDPDAVPALAQRIADLEADRDAEKARADKAEKAAATAKAKVSRGETVKAPRKLGEMKDGAALSGEELRDAIAEAEKVEIVLSDGTREIAGIPPIVAEGEVWREHVRGYMLRDPVEVTGPAIGQAGFQIDGYALLIDGKQVAYTKRSDPVNVAGGSKVSLADDIYFA